MPFITPTFDEWVEYCFTLGASDFKNCHETEALDRSIRYTEFPIDTLAAYLVRLFSQPEDLVNKYSDDQFAEAVWFLFGEGGGCWQLLYHSKELSVASKHNCLRSLIPCYTQLFDKICCNRGKDPHADRAWTSAAELDGAVYMIWDMSGVDLFAGKAEYRDTVFAVLDAILTQCRTSTCWISALHGLGHLQLDLEHEERVRTIIDKFLKRPKLPDFIREYALAAREGAVQ
ncbi:MAG: hypothetical protein RLN76_10510 [Phycisphaeraceae bacterium]